MVKLINEKNTYKLSFFDTSIKYDTNSIKNDDLLKIVNDEKYNILSNFKKFQHLTSPNQDFRRENDGVYAENIIKYLFNGVNLNLWMKNQPFVDIKIDKPIDGITIENEYLSIKSSINSTGRSVISESGIKLTQLLSYVILVLSENYNLKNYNLTSKILKLIPDVDNSKEKKIFDKKHAEKVIYYLLYYFIKDKDFFMENTYSIYLKQLNELLDKKDYDLNIDKINIKKYVNDKINEIPTNISFVFLNITGDIMEILKTKSKPLSELLNSFIHSGVFIMKGEKFKNLDFNKSDDIHIFLNISDNNLEIISNSKEYFTNRLRLSSKMKHDFFGEHEERALILLDDILNMMKNDNELGKTIENIEQFLTEEITRKQKISNNE